MFSLGQDRAFAAARRLSITLAVLAMMACAGDPTAVAHDTVAGRDDTGARISLSVLAPTRTFPGDRVRTTDNANIRATPGITGTLVGVQPLGAAGTVVAGPVYDSTGDKLTRWKIDFDTGPDGWAADLYLDQTSSAGTVGSITLAPRATGVALGKTVQLTAAVTDSAGNPVTSPSLTWTSSNAAVATVSASGLVAAVAAGTATISASSRGKTGTAAVTASQFVVGMRVHPSGGANIRNAPRASGTFLGAQPDSVSGTITGGPVTDSTGDKLVRWQVDFDTGPDGWAAQSYLVASSSPPPVAVVVASVLMMPDTAHLVIGKTLQLSAAARDAGGNAVAGTTIAFASLDTGLAKVSATGLVTAAAAGSARIVASASGHADTSIITIVPVPVAAVTVSPATASLTSGNTTQLSATARDSSGAALSGRSFTWTSSDSSIATVSASGLVTAKGAGTATIAAASGGRTGTAALTVTAATRAGHYVSAIATGSGDGSIGSPWTLPQALSGASGKVLAGDTVWLRGGTYVGAFSETVSGTAGKPIVFRQYPGERAIIDGVGVPGGGASILRVGGSYTVFWGFEITNSDPNRWSSGTTHDARPDVIANYANHTRYYSLIVHDGGVAFYNEATYSDIEITDCIIYNNGWDAPDRGHGHALYLKSNTGPITARDNILFDQFGFGVHGYSDPGSGHINGIWLDGNVAFNNGTLAGNSTSANILLGEGDTADGDVLSNNYTYFSPGQGGTNVQVGATSQNGSVQITNGYFVGGSLVMSVGNWSSATVSGNTLIGNGGMVNLATSSHASWSWGGHQYYAGGTTSAWSYLSSAYNLGGWQSATGLGASDAAMTGTPATKIIVRQSPVETGRANIIIYNWSQQGSATVDLSGIVPAGARYQVHNVQDLFGTPVASGTGPAVVTLPLAAVPAATPVGMPSTAAPSTGNAFQVFVVNLLP